MIFQSSFSEDERVFEIVFPEDDWSFGAVFLKMCDLSEQIF
jgi:hypothetical protein